MKYLLPLLLLSGCSFIRINEAPEPEKQQIKYVNVDVLDCVSLENLFNKKQLSLIDDFHKTSKECGITYTDVRVKKDLIRSYGPNYSIRTNKSDINSEDPEAPLIISEVNVEYCEISTGEATTVVKLTCQELDNLLK